MAEIPWVKKEFGGFGPAYLTMYECTGDGSGTTIAHGYPDTEVLGIWVGEINDGVGAAQYVTNTAGTATLGVTVTSTQKVGVFVLHK